MQTATAAAASSSSSGGGGARHRRTNTLLSAYYGTSPLPSPSTASVSSGFPDDGADIGSAAVSGADGRAAAVKYASELIQTLPLSRLLVCSTQMRKEAHELEARLQHVVQESYEQHCAAAHAAEALHADARGAERQVDALLDSVRGVAARTDAVNARLAHGRQRVERLEGARRALQLLQGARQLSPEMRALHERGSAARADVAALGAAAAQYCRLRPLLSRLSARHVAFREALHAVDAGAERLRADVARAMHAPPLEGGDVAAWTPAVAVALRLQLGDSGEHMAEEYLRSTEAQLPGGDGSDDDADGNGADKGIGVASKRLAFFADSVLRALADAARTYARTFDAPHTALFEQWAAEVVERRLGAGSAGACGAVLLRGDEGMRDSTSQHTSLQRKDAEKLVAHCARVEDALRAVSSQDDDGGDTPAVASRLLDALRACVHAALAGVLSEAHATVYAQLELALWRRAERAVDGREPAAELPEELSRVAASAQASAALLQEALEQRASPPADDAAWSSAVGGAHFTASTSVAAAALGERLAGIADEHELLSGGAFLDRGGDGADASSDRRLLRAAQVCALLSSSSEAPWLRRAELAAAQRALLRGYHMVKRLRVCGALQAHAAARGGAAWAAGKAVTAVVADTLEELDAVLTEAEAAERRPTAGGGARTRGGSFSGGVRLGGVALAKEEEDLSGGFSLSMEDYTQLDAAVMARGVLSAIFQSWTHFVRDEVLPDGSALERLAAAAAELRATVTRHFPKAGAAVDEATERLLQNARRRVAVSPSIS